MSSYRPEKAAERSSNSDPAPIDTLVQDIDIKKTATILHPAQVKPGLFSNWSHNFKLLCIALLSLSALYGHEGAWGEVLRNQQVVGTFVLFVTTLVHFFWLRHWIESWDATGGWLMGSDGVELVVGS